MPLMRAKLRLQSVESYGDPVYQESLHFSAVGKSTGYPPGGEDENNTFARWTPTAELTMAITNPALFGQLKAGSEFYVDFTAAE